MNNKGFAITTILYGIMVLFCFLLVSLLGILSSYRRTQEKLIENTNGARAIANGKFSNDSSSNEEPSSSSSPSTNEKPSESSSNPSPGDSSGANDGNTGRDDSTENGTFTLRFDCNGGSYYGGNMTYFDYTYTKGSSVDLSEDGCVKSGKNFFGWNTSSDATTTLNSYLMPGNDVTLYAVWK